jgi:hypothetical protein
MEISPTKDTSKLKLGIIIGSTIIAIALIVKAGAFSYPIAYAQTFATKIISLIPGQAGIVRCPNGELGIESQTQKEFKLKCNSGGGASSPTPNATTTATMSPGHGDKGKCGESMEDWHGPVVNGCQTGHEHGDAPPDWLQAWMQQNNRHLFMGHFNTSPLENTAKHNVMKGFRATFNGQDTYFRIHAGSNVGDRNSRYHSYEVWVKDQAGKVSHAQGWYNSGDPRYAGADANGNGQGSRYVRRKGVEQSQRPIILATDRTSFSQGITCEQWYGFTAEWSVDFGWTICGSTTYYNPNEINATDIYNPNTWDKTGSLGTTRRLELAWYRDNNRGNPPIDKTFWTTQFGDIVSGPNDQKCSQTTIKYGTTYQNICLDQYIASTTKSIQFPGNAVQKEFPSQGVQLPN